MVVKKAAAKKTAARKKTAAKKGPPKVIVREITMFDPNDPWLKQYPGNPRVGNMKVIRESFEENDMFEVIIVQKSTGYVLSGNHRLKVAIELGMTEIPVGIVDVTDARARKMVLAPNRANDLATYDSNAMSQLLELIDNPIGTGFNKDDYDALMDGIEHYDTKLVDAVIRPDLQIQQPEGDNSVRTSSIKKPVHVDTKTNEEKYAGLKDEDEDIGGIDTVESQAQIQAALMVSEETKFDSGNYYGIPDLLPDMLLQELPAKFETWGGLDATTDDGVTTYLWNYGVASRKGLPADRAVLGFYTFDAYFESWWNDPAYYTAKVMAMGVQTVVVPDFSLWNVDPTVFHLYNIFRAQWLGRFFQEAGLMVIPRLMFNLGDGGKSLDFCMMGIPKDAPVLAASSQHSNGKEDFKNEVNWTIKCLKELTPKTFLVYGGNPGLRMMEAVRDKMKTPDIEFRHIYNYSHIRRGVAYDKKEGLASKKEKQRLKRDKYADPDDLLEDDGDEDA